MVTLGKFKYCKTLLIQYCKLRFGLMKFSGLSVLLVMLGASVEQEWTVFIRNFVFIYFSLFIFRWIDDAWSFYLDRPKHPDRFYIKPENFKSFVLLGIFIYVLYQTGLFLYSFHLALAIFSLFLVSTVFYLLFYKRNNIMLVIPILKYPVFIWCISDFSMSNDILCLAFSSFLIMIAMDIFQKKIIGLKGILIKITLLISIGILILHPWIEQKNLFSTITLILLPLIFLVFDKIKVLPFFPIVYYPIAHIIDIILK
jgi:hypothetical protein